MSMVVCRDIFQSGDQQWGGGSAKLLSSMLRKEKAESLALMPFPHCAGKDTPQCTWPASCFAVICYVSFMHSWSDHFGRH